MISNGGFGDMSLKTLLVLYLSGSVGACLNTGWEFLFEDLLTDICPIFESATSSIKDLLLLSSLGKYYYDFLINFIVFTCVAYHLCLFFLITSKVFVIF